MAEVYWVIETVDSIGVVGQTTSFALDSRTNFHISYNSVYISGHTSSSDELK